MRALNINKPTMNIAELWEIFLQFEYDEKILLKGIENFLKKYKRKKILDCACGSGFLTLNLIKRGYDITCTDGSASMLKFLSVKAKKMGIRIKSQKILWSQLAKKYSNDFDVLLCRGSSLIYVNAWDRSSQGKKEAVLNALQNFFDVLKPGGILYIDTTTEKALRSKKPLRAKFKPRKIHNHIIEIEEVIFTNRSKKLRTWKPTAIVDGQSHSFTRYSLYLPHNELKKMLKEVGFIDVKKRTIPGEHYAVFIARKPAASRGEK
jgi:2-polyprenyl-3-methyl-5-hydroxy-6-metoxy-1,4-benzoquinol methylase